VSLKLITPPTLDIVSVAEMKAHLRVDNNEEDALIATYIKAAIAHLDGYKGVLGWCLGVQTWQLAYDTFPDGPIRLPVGPLVDVVGIEYADAGGAYTTLPSTAYEVDAVSDPGWIVPVEAWPSVDGTNAVLITFRAGHATVAEIHPAIPVIVMLLAAHWYQNREAVAESMSEVPMSASALIAAHRRHQV
jgi:uncharacterized phiE125 gp8 family phage protein